MLTAMDAVRQRRVTFPDLPPDRRIAVTRLLGIAPTCGNPQQVLARAQSARLALGTLHPTHPCTEHGMVTAALLGVPDDRLPVSVHCHGHPHTHIRLITEPRRGLRPSGGAPRSPPN